MMDREEREGRQVAKGCLIGMVLSLILWVIGAVVWMGIAR